MTGPILHYINPIIITENQNHESKGSILTLFYRLKQTNKQKLKTWIKRGKMPRKHMVIRHGNKNSTCFLG